MIRFIKIEVTNYKAIKYAELNFNSGIYKVIGVNNDSTYTSNGAGKSTIMQALVLCLYNKDFTGAPLESLNNRSSNSPYTVSVTFMATIDGEDKLVNVTNSSGTTRMRLTINDVQVGLGATAVIPMVEKIIGMGYNTFKLTHYITSSTISNLTQNLSQPTIFNDILHLVEIQELDKKLLSISKDINNELEELRSKDRAFKQAKQILDMQNRYDLSQIEKDIEVFKNSLDDMEVEYYSNTYELKEAIVRLNDTSSKLNGMITEAVQTLRHGVCSLCNTILVSKESLEAINSTIAENKALLIEIDNELERVTTELSEIDYKHLSSKGDVINSISMLSQDLNTAREFSELDIKKLKDPSQELSSIEKESLFIASARKEIKSGRILKDVLDQFFNIVSMKIQEYSELIKMHFTIEILSDKLGMSIQITQDKILVPIESLSNGERTRLSLLVLISMLDAMKVVSESETNVVVFDESSASLDASGAEEMMNLFTYLKHLGQSVFLITHGSELDMIPYDYQLTVSKQDGQSNILVQEL